MGLFNDIELVKYYEKIFIFKILTLVYVLPFNAEALSDVYLSGLL